MSHLSELPQRLDHYAFVVRDHEVNRRFFEDVLGLAYKEVWRRLVLPEKDCDPDKKGFAVLIKVERAEDLDGQPLVLA